MIKLKYGDYYFLFWNIQNLNGYIYKVLLYIYNILNESIIYYLYMWIILFKTIIKGVVIILRW